MIVSIYLILKVLIFKILLNPMESGMVPPNIKHNHLLGNFKILGSVLFFVFMEYIEQMIPGMSTSDDMFLQNNLDRFFYFRRELKMFYSEVNYDFRCEIFGIIDKWLENMYLLIAKA